MALRGIQWEDKPMMWYPKFAPRPRTSVRSAAKERLKWLLRQGLGKSALTICTILDLVGLGEMEKSSVFYEGQMVESIPDYCVGSSYVPPSIDYPFEGIGIIVKLEWPNKAQVYTTKGEVLCLTTDRLIPIVKRKKR